jgi:hypothetical protein
MKSAPEFFLGVVSGIGLTVIAGVSAGLLDASIGFIISISMALATVFYILTAKPFNKGNAK